MRNRTIKIIGLMLCLLPLAAGCNSSEETSAQDADKMKNAMQGKGYGEMPAETRRQMEEAMRNNRGGKPATPASGGSTAAPPR